MFGNEQNEVEKYLIKEGYEVVTFWSGKHIIKVSNGFYG